MDIVVDKKQLTSLFDQQAAHYDQQWQKMAPINDGLYFFLKSILAPLPEDAKVLCVGAGTGKELIFLAGCFPQWQFTVVEPSTKMLQLCRQSVENQGFTSRCTFHHSYLDSLSIEDKHDAATCFLVSQFILDRDERSAFFRQIANVLLPGGLLVSADLVSDTHSENYQELLALWMRAMSSADIAEENIQRMEEAYAKDVAILTSGDIASIIAAGGFSTPVPFYQAGLIQAFVTQKPSLIN
jgi:tRNA (cmo5U34)-methyltransferase